MKRLLLDLGVFMLLCRLHAWLREQAELEVALARVRGTIEGYQAMARAEADVARAQATGRLPRPPRRPHRLPDGGVVAIVLCLVGFAFIAYHVAVAK